MHSPLLLLIACILFLQSGCNKVDLAGAENKPLERARVQIIGSDDERTVVDSSHIQLGQVWEFKQHFPDRDGVGIPFEAISWAGRVEFMDESNICLGDVAPILPGFTGEEKIFIKRSLIREIKQIDPDELRAMREKGRRLLAK